MAITVDQSAPYVSLQKEYAAKQAGVKKWEDIFLQPYEQAAQQVQTQAAYDISGAFAQYKQAQLSAMHNTQLGSGFKEQIASSLAGQYATAFAQAKQQEASDIFTLQQQASKTLESEEAKLLENAKMYAGLEEALLEQHGIDIKQAQTSEKAVFGKDNKGADVYGLGYFELQPDGSYAITERGKNFFDKALNKGLALTDEQGKETGEYEQFADYLKTTGREDLYDFYVQNLGTTREFMGGIESMKYDENREQKIEQENYDYALSQAKKRNKYISEVNPEIEWSSVTHRNGTLTVRNKRYDMSSVGAGDVVRSPVLDAVAGPNRKNLNSGDIFEYEGKTYYYEKLTGSRGQLKHEALWLLTTNRGQSKGA